MTGIAHPHLALQLLPSVSMARHTSTMAVQLHASASGKPGNRRYWTPLCGKPFEWTLAGCDNEVSALCIRECVVLCDC